MEFKYTDVVMDGDKMVKQTRKDGKNAYYSIGFEGKVYEFIVPFEDGGDTFKEEDKSIYFARWIRKSMETGDFKIVSV